MLKFFTQFPEIIAMMSEKSDGSMKLFNNDNSNIKNRNNFFDKIGINNKNVVSAELAHSANVFIINNDNTKTITQADGLITANKNIYLAITIADCIPIFFYDPNKKIVGISHAGWRGIVGNIANNTINKMVGLGGNIEKMKVSMGPGISSNHFEIRKDILNEFKSYKEHVIEKENKIFVDLKGILLRQLLDAGIKEFNIENNNECTFENSKKYFSYRRDKPEKLETMIALIGIKK